MRTFTVRVSDACWTLLRSYYDDEVVVEHLVTRQLEAHVASVVERIENDRRRLTGYLPDDTEQP